MKILVVGSGFIGKSIIETLEAEGHQILVFSRRFKPQIKSQQIIGDIFVFEDFLKSLAWQPEVLIHTAWITDYKSYMKDSLNYKYADFTSRLGSYLNSTEVKHFIALGTGAEYGSRIYPSSAGKTVLNPENLYSQQKVNALTSVLESTKISNMRFSWARVFQPYGPGQDQNRLIPYLATNLKNDLEITLEDTTTLRDWITTRDIASAISWIINNESPIEVDIGTSTGYTNLDLLKAIQSLTGITPRLSEKSQRDQDVVRISVVGKDSPLLKAGWTPKDDLYSGLSWTLNL